MMRKIVLWSLVLLTVSSMFVSAQKPIDILKAYTVCKFDDGLKISDVDHVVKKGNEPRAVETSKGLKEVSRIGSYRVMIKYPEHDYFMANIRPERSLAAEFENDKATVIDSLEYTWKDNDTIETKTPLKETYNGFDFRIIYRKAFGFEKYKTKNNPNGNINTVGIGILFSDLDQTLTTMYFFNTIAPKGRGIGFKSIDEWNTSRKAFLMKYTQCINSALNR